MDMRLICVADTHQFHDELVVPDGDVFICAGDVGRGGDIEELEAFFSWFRRFPHKHKLFVPGNHDGCLEDAATLKRFRADIEDVVILVDEACIIDDIKFYGSPWTPTFHDWAFMRARGAELAETWRHIPNDTDVLITHGPPFRILDDVSGYRFGLTEEQANQLDDRDRFQGCEALRTRVFDVVPRVHLFGHIHARRGLHIERDIFFVNCTTQECDLPPAIIDLDDDGAVVVNV